MHVVLTFDEWESNIGKKKDSSLEFHQKVARAPAELWMNVTHADDAFWCVVKEYFLRRWIFVFKLARSWWMRSVIFQLVPIATWWLGFTLKREESTKSSRWRMHVVPKTTHASVKTQLDRCPAQKLLSQLSGSIREFVSSAYFCW